MKYLDSLISQLLLHHVHHPGPGILIQEPQFFLNGIIAGQKGFPGYAKPVHGSPVLGLEYGVHREAGPGQAVVNADGGQHVINGCPVRIG